MAYQVLARKWRPRSFAEMVGQTPVLRALQNALDRQHLHHAYLFTGTRGVGKTTVARVFAKALNCEAGVSATPCGQCASCVEIDEGRFMDLIEVDAASRTRVDETRELLDNVQYAPTRGRFKVYLIDEVHMFSNHSFNALLKTLEEPPPHVKFLLATTEPRRIPVTILSRCLAFDLKRIGTDLIAARLTHILSAEGIASEPAATFAIALAADGSMRDALSLLDQSIAHGGGQLREADVRAMLGRAGAGQALALVQRLAAGDAEGLLEVIEATVEYAPDYEAVLGEILDILHRVAVCQVLGRPVAEASGADTDIAALADTLAAEDGQLFYQIALIGRRDLGLAPDPRRGFEMVMLRMLAFQRETARDESIARRPMQYQYKGAPVAQTSGAAARAPVEARRREALPGRPQRAAHRFTGCRDCRSARYPGLGGAWLAIADRCPRAYGPLPGARDALCPGRRVAARRGFSAIIAGGTYAPPQCQTGGSSRGGTAQASWRRGPLPRHRDRGQRSRRRDQPRRAPGAGRGGPPGRGPARHRPRPPRPGPVRRLRGAPRPGDGTTPLS